MTFVSSNVVLLMTENIKCFQIINPQMHVQRDRCVCVSVTSLQVMQPLLQDNMQLDGNLWSGKG